tara:strand:+ start:8452 stop:9282 length:831 start_codon:yes stop_codon:yes gene_type:complete
MKGLSLSGGGIFGIGQARILDVSDTSKFDFFVGTSIGAVNAAACAVDINIETTPFFKEEMPKIFKGYCWKRLKPFAPRYGDKALNDALIRLFDGILLGDVKKPLFVTCVDINTKRLKVFDSTDPNDADVPLWEVLRAATAAETYFSPWKGRADGGVFANNPSMVAIAAASSSLGYDVTDIELCSIGTGSENSSNKLSGLRPYSLLSWSIWLITALLNGAASSMHDYFVRSLPLKKYTRVQFVRGTKWNMDSVKDMFKAEGAWENDIQKAIKAVNEF